MAKYVHIHENIAPVVAGIGGAAGSFGEAVAVGEVDTAIGIVTIGAVGAVCAVVAVGEVIVHICHKHHKRCLWRKSLSYGEIFPYDRLSCGEILHVINFHVEKALDLRNVKKICNVEK